MSYLNLSKSHITSAKRWDKVARWVITSFGVGVILTILLFLIVIFYKCLPLVGGTSFEPLLSFKSSQSNSPIVQVGVDILRQEKVNRAFLLKQNGTLEIYQLNPELAEDKATQLLEEVSLAKPEQGKTKVIKTFYDGKKYLGIQWDNKVCDLYRLSFVDIFDQYGVKSLVTRREYLESIPFPHLAKSIEIRVDDENSSKTFMALFENGEVEVHRKSVDEDSFLDEGEEITQKFQIRSDEGPFELVALDRPGVGLYGVTSEGHIEQWNLSEEDPILKDRVALGESHPSSISVLLGDLAIAVGYQNGDIKIFAPIDQDHKKVLYPIHDLKGMEGRVDQVYPSPRNRLLVSQNDRGKLSLNYTTNEKHLLSEQPFKGPSLMSMGARGRTWIGADSEGEIKVYQIHSEHPEFSFSTIFAPLWYEGYSEVDFTWQSSAGTEDYEPKYSMVNLVWGSLKGAIYAMIISVPLGILAALYTSQFAGNRLKGYIKPVIEIMAAMPSVVVGFLAAYWFAPELDNHLLLFFVAIILMPFFAILILLMPVPKKIISTGRSLGGIDLLIVSPLILLFFLTSYGVAFGIDSIMVSSSGMNFKSWFVDEFLKGEYEIRNSIVIGFALGFTVIPIIFTISEDALSSVPKGLSSAALALGATPWQTAWNIVLPAASPGIFAGIILGFGRAVGETMIVLMAVGSTPIIEMNPFTGMRPLSANIAIEIPEAPKGSTHERILFLSAGLLLIFTSVLNTTTEAIRHRLRKTYSKF